MFTDHPKNDSMLKFSADDICAYFLLVGIPFLNVSEFLTLDFWFFCFFLVFENVLYFGVYGLLQQFWEILDSSQIQGINLAVVSVRNLNKR